MKPAETTVRAFDYLRERPGETIHYGDVAAAVGADPVAINQAPSRTAREHPERGIVREGASNGRYVYRPDAEHPARRPPPDGPKPGDLFEVVGTLSGGTVVVRDPVTFELFRLQPA
ncbi:MAG: hypothetical protein FWE15_20955 [Actinomycetia bacterium]|nr:hypothetical protein [Actinomycetes bacterium]